MAFLLVLSRLAPTKIITSGQGGLILTNDQNLSDKIINLAGSGESIEAYGKAAIAGSSSEIEHASAIIHTLRFGNFYREAVKAKSYLGFTNSRGPVKF